MHATARGSSEGGSVVNGSRLHRRRRRWVVASWGWGLAPLLALWAVAVAAPDREAEETAARAASANGKSKICGIPGGPPCAYSDETKENEDEYDVDYGENYGSYDGEYGELPEDSRRVNASIPIVESFPYLEPMPPQLAQMMLQEAAPFTWLVQSDTPPRSGVTDDWASNSLLGGMNGGGKKRRGNSREPGVSRERSMRSAAKLQKERLWHS